METPVSDLPVSPLPTFRLHMVKGDLHASHQAALFDASNESLSHEQFRTEEEALLWIARFGVQRYCGLTGLAPATRESVSVQAELVVKVLIDAHFVASENARHVLNTSLLLFRELHHPAPSLSVSALSFCLAFIHRTLTRWESLEAGQSFDLELAASS